MSMYSFGQLSNWSKQLAKIEPFLILTGIILIVVWILFLFKLFRRFMRSNIKIQIFDVYYKGGARFAIIMAIKEIRFYLIRLIKKIIITPDIFRNRYWIEDNAVIVLYKFHLDNSLPYTNYQPQRTINHYDQSHPSLQVSLIATVKNEENNVKAWATSIFKQTRLPDEIIITDAGSIDRTVEYLQELAIQSPVPFHIISKPDVNIAEGRNIAIKNAQFNIIATSDCGCRLHPDWLEKILVPFTVDPRIEVVAGMYQAIDQRENIFDRNAWWTNKSIIDPKWFLPSGRSSAFRKGIWNTIGGYPEWLTMTGEDTYFAMELKKYAKWWAFVPEAVTDWYAPDTALSYWKKIYNWSIGDGESGVNASSYWKLVLQILFLNLLFFILALIQALIGVLPFLQPLQLFVYLFSAFWFVLMILFLKNENLLTICMPIEMGGLIAKILGYIQGAKRHHQIEIKRNKLVEGSFFILSGIPIDDTGGGARCTQIALELLRRKFAVVFINKFPKYEAGKLNLSINDNYLYKYQVSKLDWNRFWKENGWLFNRRMVCALIEMPLPDFIPIIKKIRDNGGMIIYDLIDDWDTQLGADWYSEEDETKIINASQAFTATAPVLAERLSRTCSNQVELVPNAVNTRLFNPDRFYERPLDFPKSDWYIIYIGALWGEWFDWDLLVDIGEKYPEASIIVIGDYKGQSPRELPNLHFLGLKPQKVIPAYLANSDVAIIPWKVNQITRATDPLKVYEYLAMRKPVVSSEIPPLKQIPGVYLAHDNREFIDLVGKVRKSTPPNELISQFINENSWQVRVDQLLNLINQSTDAAKKVDPTEL